MKTQANVKNTRPKISVIVPVYNIENYIDECVESIVGQTYTNLEIILVNDKTPDNSGKICDKWAKKDQRITVVHKTENEGLNMARYSGWQASSGELIAFIDGDDMVDKKYIETLYDCLSTTNTDIAAVGYQVFQHNESPVVHQDDSYRHEVFSRAEIIKHYATRQQYISFQGNLTTVHCKLFKRAIVEKVDWHKSNYSIGEDDFFSLMCYANCKKVAIVFADLYFYRMSPQSISRSKGLSVKFNGKEISIFTLIEDHKKLSIKLLGNDFYDETYFRMYNLYMYYIGLLILKNAWSDSEVTNLQNSITKNIDDLLRIKKYDIDRTLLENVKRNGSVYFFVHIINEKEQELLRLDTEISRLRPQLKTLGNEVEKLRSELGTYLGIKRSAKLLAGNIKRKVTKI